MNEDTSYKLAGDELLAVNPSASGDAIIEKGTKPKKKDKGQFLSQRVVDRAKAKDKEYTIYGRTPPGFGLRKRPTGHASFILVYKKNGRTHRIIIGDPNAMTLQEAESRAYKALQNIREHGEPDGEVSGIAAVYNRYKYEKEKREALELWQAHLAMIAVKHKDYVPKNPDDDIEL